MHIFLLYGLGQLAVLVLMHLWSEGSSTDLK